MSIFDQKARGWDSNPMHRERSEAIVKHLLESIPVTKEMTVIEVGAGTGIMSFLLKDRVKSITMLDSSAEMVRVMKEKISASGSRNLYPELLDLVIEEWKGPATNLAISQMVLHHIHDTSKIIERISRLLLPSGFIAIADLYREDGSFHDDPQVHHQGFDPEELVLLLRRKGFTGVSYRKCFVINKRMPDNTVKPFDVFLMTAQKKG